MKLCRYMLPCGYCEKYNVPCQAEPDLQDGILSIKENEENKRLDDIIEYLLNMLEEEHMGMYGVALSQIEEKFGYQY